MKIKFNVCKKLGKGSGEYAYLGIVTGPIEPGQTLSREVPGMVWGTNTECFEIQTISYLGKPYESENEIGQTRCVCFTSDKGLASDTEWYCESNAISTSTEHPSSSDSSEYRINLPEDFKQAVRDGLGPNIRTSLRQAIQDIEPNQMADFKQTAIKYLDDESSDSDLYKYMHAAFVEYYLEKQDLNTTLKHYNDCDGDLPEDTLRDIIKKFIEVDRTKDLVFENYYVKLFYSTDINKRLKISREYALFCILNDCLDNVKKTLERMGLQKSEEYNHISNALNEKLDINDYLFFAKIAMAIEKDELVRRYLLRLPQHAIPKEDKNGLFAKLGDAAKLENDTEKSVKQYGIYKKISAEYPVNDFDRIIEKIKIPGVVYKSDLEIIFDSFQNDGLFDSDQKYDISGLDENGKKNFCDKFRENLETWDPPKDGWNVRMQFVVKLFARCGLKEDAVNLCVQYSEHLSELYHAAYLIEKKLGNSEKANEYLKAADEQNIPYAKLVNWELKNGNKNIDNEFDFNDIKSLYNSNKYHLTEAGFLIAKYCEQKVGKTVFARNYYYDGYKKGYAPSVKGLKQLVRANGSSILIDEMRNFARRGELVSKHWLEQLEDILNEVTPVPPGPIVDEEYLLSCNERELLSAYDELKTELQLNSFNFQTKELIRFAEARLGEIYYVRYKLAKMSEDENFRYKMFLDSAEKAALFSPDSQSPSHCVFPNEDGNEITNFDKNYCRGKAVEYLCKVLNCDESNPPNTVSPEYAWSAFYLADIEKDNGASESFVRRLLGKSQIPQAEFILSKWYGTGAQIITQFNIDDNRSFEYKAELKTLVAFAKMDSYNTSPNGANFATKIEQLALDTITGPNTGRKFSYDAVMQAITDPGGFYRHISRKFRDDYLDSRINAIMANYHN